MNDSRMFPCNGRVAAIELVGQAEADRFVEGKFLRCVTSISSIRTSPNSGFASQLLFGEEFRVLEQVGGWAFGQSGKDGYVGYVRDCHLQIGKKPTHRVCAMFTHLYAEPSIKSPPTLSLHFGSMVAVAEVGLEFATVPGFGFIPAKHIEFLSVKSRDFVSVAERFLGMPYLWGGKGPTGIDCSGLVQVAMHAAGRKCPRDSDMQRTEFECSVPAGELRRGDLAFWDGHVGIVANRETILHSTAYHMSVVSEPIRSVIDRIESGDNCRFHGFRRP